MPTLTQSQIDALKNKGLNDEKIAAIAQQRGYEMPKDGFFKSVGKALIKSETGFGQSIAGGLGNVLPGSFTSKKAVEESNAMTRQVTNNLITRIKEKRAKGEDVTRLMNALKTVDKEVNFYDILNASTGGSLDKTGKQVFGEGLGVFADIASAGTYSKAGLLGQSKLTSGLSRGIPSAVPTLTTKTFGQGFKQGAKTGALGGGLIGASQGLTGGMQENLSGGEITGRTIREGVLGGVTGLALGGALGGVSGAIRGKAQRVATKEDAFLKDLVSPKATAEVKQQAFKEGRVTEQGLLSASKITPSKRDVQLAEAIKGIVSPKNSPLVNAKALDDTVRELNTGLKAYVAQNKVPFNTNQLKSQLNAGKNELKLIFASDKNAEKTYDAVVDEFIKLVKNKDTAGLMDARQAFDKIPAIKKLLDSQGLAENVKKEVVHTARDMANKYVASLLPKGNRYRETLLRESKIIEVIENMGEKYQQNIGKNNLQILAQRYPLIKVGLGTIGVGALGATGVGIGNAIINSTN